MWRWWDWIQAIFLNIFYFTPFPLLFVYEFLNKNFTAKLFNRPKEFKVSGSGVPPSFLEKITIYVLWISYRIILHVYPELSYRTVLHLKDVGALLPTVTVTKANDKGVEEIERQFQDDDGDLTGKIFVN